MREILFRGKTKDNEWVEGSLLQYNDKKYILPFENEDLELSGLFGKLVAKNLEVIPETVGQYTGSSDKNGIKIFEGNILIRQDTRSTYLVMWNKDCIVCRQMYDSWTDKNVLAYKKDVSVTFMTTFKIEIIGNIHEKEDK